MKEEGSVIHFTNPKGRLLCRNVSSDSLIMVSNVACMCLSMAITNMPQCSSSIDRRKHVCGQWTITRKECVLYRFLIKCTWCGSLVRFVILENLLEGIDQMFPGLWQGGPGGPSPESLERLKGMMVRPHTSS